LASLDALDIDALLCRCGEGHELNFDTLSPAFEHIPMDYEYVSERRKEIPKVMHKILEYLSTNYENRVICSLMENLFSLRNLLTFALRVNMQNGKSVRQA
jgi:hypothetical protein